MKRDEKGPSNYKTVNKLIRNEDMTRAEARKDVKGMETVTKYWVRHVTQGARLR